MAGSCKNSSTLPRSCCRHPMKTRRPGWHDSGYRNSLRSGTFVSHTSLWASEMGRYRKILARDKRTLSRARNPLQSIHCAGRIECSHRFRLAGRGTGPPRTAGRAGPRFHRGRQGRELQARLPLRLAPVCGLVPAPGASRPAGHARTVTLYMTPLAADHKPASLQRKLTSITKAHQAAGFPSPATMQHAVVSIRRTLGTAQPGKEPLLTADIREMLDSLDDDLQGCRDRALLLAGFAGGFRRSELAALDVGDVSETEDGFVIRVRRSKTDPEGKGTSVALPYGSAGATCPVRSYLPRLDRQGSPHRGAGLPRRRPARAIHLTTSETRNMPEAVSQTFAPPSADDPLLATIRQLGDTFNTFSPRAYPRNQACAVWVLTPSVLTAQGTRQRGSLPDRGATSSLDGMGPFASPERHATSTPAGISYPRPRHRPHQSGIAAA